MKQKKRCTWVCDNELYIHYHDHEWGQTIKNSQALFELLMLEGLQAGLSWITILKKRNDLRTAFAQFQPDLLCKFNQDNINQLMKNEKIIRNKRKITAIINNAATYIKLRHEGVNFSKWLWETVEHQTVYNSWKNSTEVPAQTNESILLSKKLKQAGFSFVGPTICYAFMQSCNMVNDHTQDCFLYNKALRE